MIKVSGKLFILPTIFLLLSIINYSSYIVDVHDCSNMAAEQYTFFNKIGFDTYICVGDFNGYSHSWVSINGYEYDSVSLFPMWIYRINNPQLSDTRYYTMDKEEYPEEWKTHYISYLNSIPMLFILYIFNILRIKVIRPVIQNADT